MTFKILINNYAVVKLKKKKIQPKQKTTKPK